MSDNGLAKIFDVNAAADQSLLSVVPPSLLSVEAYQALLTKLLTAGAGYGKTKPVAAFHLRNMFVVTETDSNKAQNEIKVEDLYVVMDPKDYPNAYSRSLVMQDIATTYARRMAGEVQFNAPDYKGPGIWTSKRAAFEFDYVASKQEPLHDEYGRPLNLYNPNPDAFRVCLKSDTAFIMPVTWGEWTVKPGGVVAIRERDVAALTQALADIRKGVKTAHEALYAEDGIRAKFDVYGMEPGFLEANYDPVKLKRGTKQRMAALKRTGTLDELNGTTVCKRMRRCATSRKNQK